MAFWDKISGRRKKELGAPASGEAIAMEEVDDEVFSAGMLGPGMAVVPDGERIIAPCAGVIDTVFETGHALTMRTDCGAQVLIHIGINTVELGGKHFRIRCAAGQRVNRGDLLIEFDRHAIEEAGYDPVVIMVVPEGGMPVKTLAGRRVSEGETVLCLA